MHFTVISSHGVLFFKQNILLIKKKKTLYKSKKSKTLVRYQQKGKDFLSQGLLSTQEL